ARSTPLPEVTRGELPRRRPAQPQDRRPSRPQARRPRERAGARQPGAELQLQPAAPRAGAAAHHPAARLTVDSGVLRRPATVPGLHHAAAGPRPRRPGAPAAPCPPRPAAPAAPPIGSRATTPPPDR